MGDCHRSWLPLEVDGESLLLKPPHVSLEGREESSEDLAGGVLLAGIAFTVPESAMQAARGNCHQPSCSAADHVCYTANLPGMIRTLVEQGHKC